jgi:hypothetical protein
LEKKKMSAQTSPRRRLFALVVVAMLAGMAVPAGPALADTEACPSTIPSAGYRDLAGLSSEAVEAINCITYYRIAEGATSTRFDPGLLVPRWQMALFLIRAADDLGIPLPSGSDQGFTDLSGVSIAARTAINQLAQLGVTKGTGPRAFAPYDPVPRWQMALFLTRLYAKAGLTLPSGAPQGFVDIYQVPAEAWYAINQIAQLGVSRGMTARMFGPWSYVYRWQMALFLARQLQAGYARAMVVTVTPDVSTAPTGSVVTLTLRVRGLDGTGVANRYVDVFVGGIDSAGQCRLDADAYLNGGDAGTGSNCRIDTGDPRTDFSGRATVTFTHSGVTETDTVYAWIGDVGQHFDADTVRTYDATSVRWSLPREDQAVLTQAAVTSVVGEPVTLTAEVTDRYADGYYRVRVWFVVSNGAEVELDDDTNSSGIAQVTWTPTDSDIYTVDAWVDFDRDGKFDTHDIGYGDVVDLTHYVVQSAPDFGEERSFDVLGLDAVGHTVDVMELDGANLYRLAYDASDSFTVDEVDASLGEFEAALAGLELPELDGPGKVELVTVAYYTDENEVSVFQLQTEP